jgi:uncharacterized protein (UPF0332 family)
LNDRQTLVNYRLDQAKTTLEDARLVLSQGGSPRSAVNRSYYAVFYMVLALFLKAKINLKTSKHSGVIAFFDKHFVSEGTIAGEYSRIMYNLFDDRQEFDYKELSAVSNEDASTAVANADKFISFLTEYINRISDD